VKVLVLAQANDSLRRSLQYLSRYYDQRYLLAMERLIRQRIKWLADNPGGGQFEPELEWSNKGYRRLVVKEFMIIYRIDDEVIVVYDIFDSRRDPTRMKG